MLSGGEDLPETVDAVIGLVVGVVLDPPAAASAVMVSVMGRSEARPVEVRKRVVVIAFYLSMRVYMIVLNRMVTMKWSVLCGQIVFLRFLSF